MKTFYDRCHLLVTENDRAFEGESSVAMERMEEANQILDSVTVAVTEESEDNVNHEIEVLSLSGLDPKWLSSIHPIANMQSDQEK